MMKFQKLTAGLLVLAMMGTNIPANLPLLTVSAADAAASEGTCGENAAWKFDESTGTMTFSGTGEIENDAWRESVSAAQIKAIVIENGITSIGKSVFFNCINLTSVTIPDSVTSIGELAFNSCGALPAITIPESVTSIGKGAFYNCGSLTAVTIPEGVTEIANETFYDCKKLTEVNIPDSVTSIGDYAFRYCESLTRVTIPDSVTSIGNLAFEICGLTEITIPDSVTSIGKAAFRMCEGLTTVTIPESVTSIREYAFSKTPWLTEQQQAHPQVIVNGILIDATLCEGDVVIADGVTSVGNYAFEHCKALTAVTIPDSVTSIGDGAFLGCTSLTSVTIPDKVTSIGIYAFDDCTSLTSVTILHPACEIYDADNTICNGWDSEAASYTYTGTIYGYEGSTAQAYAEEYGYTFQSIGAAPAAEALLGDVSGDAKVDASDAADLLIALAAIGAGAESGLTDAQTAAADADGNGTLNASDATTILQYAAYIGAGGTGTLADFLAAQQG